MSFAAMTVSIDNQNAMKQSLKTQPKLTADQRSGLFLYLENLGGVDPDRQDLTNTRLWPDVREVAGHFNERP